MSAIITVDRLGKRYRIGRRERYLTLRDTVTRAFTAPIRFAAGVRRRMVANSADESDPDSEFDSIWALDDLSFELRRGEVLGIVGHNGAGKSTLLRILSRITEPTVGRVDLFGRVGTLLEVGTGFHPELTGRENVFLNGAILGMKRAEIARKFDEIVSFAEVATFIDTPVKHYSSGMYVRLAFSVAAHLEPDILLVDEALAVGDARFWSKSTQKMRAVNAQGVTIVLVTHNMWLVRTVCTRALCLSSGRLIADGDPDSIVRVYREGAEVSVGDRGARAHGNYSRVSSGRPPRILHLDAGPLGTHNNGSGFSPERGLHISIAVDPGDLIAMVFRLRVTSLDGLPYFTVYSRCFDAPGRSEVICDAEISHLMLLPGEYRLWVAVCSTRGEEEILADDSISLLIQSDRSPDPRFNLFWNNAIWRFEGRE